MNYNGENKCFVCDHNIRWQAHVSEAGKTARALDGTRVQADVVAIGKITTTSGLKTEYEIVAECPNCKNKNKFK